MLSAHSASARAAPPRGGKPFPPPFSARPKPIAFRVPRPIRSKTIRSKTAHRRPAAALDKGKVYRAANIDACAKLLADKLGLPEDTLLQSTDEGDWQGSADAIGHTDTIMGYYKAQQQVFIDNGRIEAEVPVTDYVLEDVITAGDELYETIK